MTNPAMNHTTEPAAATETGHTDALPATPLRILWVKVGGLWPVNTGGRLRSFHLIEALSVHHEVSVLTTHDPAEDGGELARHLPRCKSVESVPHRSAKRDSLAFIGALARSWFSRLPVDLYKSRIPALRDRVASALADGSYDLCVADFLFAVPNVPMDGPTPVVFFEHNVEYMIWRRLCRNETNPVRRAILAVEWRKMRRCEIRACRAAALTVAVSEEDRDLLAKDVGEARIEAIPTGVDIDYFKPGLFEERRPRELVFTGSMDWHPNEDAMLWFIDAILPRVREEMPDVDVTVVGRNPTDRLKKEAAAAGVNVTGTVPDVRPYINRAAVYVVPLRVGGGTRLKIYEALAMGKAIVSTTIGAEGLPLEEGVHILRADEPEAFARHTVELLRDEDRQRRLGEAGRALMEQFAWPEVARVFERHCRGVEDDQG